MNIPGFTAEASLAKTIGRYTLVPIRATGAFGRALIPQQIRRLGTPNQPCIPGCICVSPFGCPCCDSIGWPWPTTGPFDPTDPFRSTGPTFPF
jgi:hypothetical protein